MPHFSNPVDIIQYVTMCEQSDDMESFMSKVIGDAILNRLLQYFLEPEQFSFYHNLGTTCISFSEEN